MNRYYVEFEDGVYLYVMAYNKEHVKDIFPNYKLVGIEKFGQMD